MARRTAIAAEHAAAGDDAVMLGALGVMAYVASMMTHEALGHGIYCLLAGGHNVALSGWSEGCSLHPEPLSVPAAGPAVQLGGGLLAWLALRVLPTRQFLVLRCFLWLYMVFDMLISTGYVAFSGVTDFGDGAVLVAGLPSHAMWRGLLIIVGAVGYYLSLWAAALELRRLLSSNADNRRARRFLWIPYLTAGVVACGAGALNRTSAPGVALGLAAISSFGAGFGIVRLSDLRCRVAITTPVLYVRRSIPWLAAAAAVGAFFGLVLGPGIPRPPVSQGSQR
jgi:hypothetical protein